MPKKYSSKLGLELVLPIATVLLTILGLAALEEQRWIALSIILPIVLFIAYTFLNTYYIIQDETLIVKSGFIYHQKSALKPLAKLNQQRVL